MKSSPERSNLFRSTRIMKSLLVCLALFAFAALSYGRDGEVKGRVQVKAAVPVVVQPQQIQVRPNPPIPEKFLRAEISTNKNRYLPEQPLRISFSVSDDAYVYIFDTDTEGITRQIFPNFYDQENFVKGDRKYTLPGQGYSLVATGRPGREYLQLVAVTDRNACPESYNRFDRNDPYPKRPGKQEALDKWQKSKSIGIAPQSIEIRPDPRCDARGTAETTFEILPPPPPVVPTGMLDINTNPREAKIYVDGKFIGHAPEKVRVPYGEHRIEVRKENFYSKTVIIDVNDEYQSVKVNLKRPYRRW